MEDTCTGRHVHACTIFELPTKRDLQYRQVDLVSIYQIEQLRCPKILSQSDTFEAWQ